MSSISSVINNLISARATQTHTDRDHALMKGIIRFISDRGSRFLSRSLEIVLSPFISTSQAEHVKASDKTHLKGRAADCMQQVRRGDKTTRSSVRAEMHHPNTSTGILPRVNSKADQGRCLAWCLRSYDVNAHAVIITRAPDML